ncbi:MAG: LysR family transcriptional regulator, partial [Eubacterium sp.]|nr:LysR family transcriptional regulator [Eubacterium sp.]
ISRAAEELFISPQGLSKTISRLEDELGVELFKHKANRIIPTAEAANLAAHAKSILIEYDLIENHLFKTGRSKKPAKIACSYDVPQMIPTEFFVRFDAAHPELRMQIREYPENMILERLDKSKVEVAIVSGPLDEIDYEIIPIFTVPYCLVINKDHPLASRKVIRLEDLDDEPLAVKDTQSRISAMQILELAKHDSTPDYILESSDAHLIHAMAESGAAIAVTLSYLANKIKSEAVVVRPFEDDIFTKTIYLVKKKNYVMSYEGEQLYESIREYFSDK